MGISRCCITWRLSKKRKEKAIDLYMRTAHAKTLKPLITSAVVFHSYCIGVPAKRLGIASRFSSFRINMYSILFWFTVGSILPLASWDQEQWHLTNTTDSTVGTKWKKVKTNQRNVMCLIYISQNHCLYCHRLYSTNAVLHTPMGLNGSSGVKVNRNVVTYCDICQKPHGVSQHLAIQSKHVLPISV